MTKLEIDARRSVCAEEHDHLRVCQISGVPELATQSEHLS